MRLSCNTQNHKMSVNSATGFKQTLTGSSTAMFCHVTFVLEYLSLDIVINCSFLGIGDLVYKECAINGVADGKS